MTIRTAVDCAARSARKGFRSCMEPLSKCRACGKKVAIFDDVCAHCGAGGPAELPVSPSFVWTTFASVAYLLFMTLT